MAVVGVAGLVLPVLPGWLLIGAGALMVFPAESRTGRTLRSRLRNREEALIARIEQRRAAEGIQRAA